MQYTAGDSFRVPSSTAQQHRAHPAISKRSKYRERPNVLRKYQASDNVNCVGNHSLVPSQRAPADFFSGLLRPAGRALRDRFGNARRFFARISAMLSSRDSRLRGWRRGQRE